MSGYMQKEYKLPDGRTVTADFNELGCAMVTIQALDALFDILNSSDAVEVVRCKDCKYRSKEWHEDKRHKDGGYWLVCCENDAIAERIYGLAQDNDYCSYGERAEE